jgi:hypothetical protein
MTDDLYYRKMESTSTTDLVDMIRERDERIAELEKDNAELKAILNSVAESDTYAYLLDAQKKAKDFLKE